MRKKTGSSLWVTVLQGLIVGLVATEALDLLSTAMYQSESDTEREREDDARGNLHVYEVAVDQLTRSFGVPLQKKDLHVWGWRFHKAFGVLGGVQYMLMRRIEPRIGAAGGLGFGFGFFVVVDELMMPLLGWSPGPSSFSWKVHARGAVSHLSYGVAAELTARSLEAFQSAA